jgi:acetylcholinesterase
MSHTFKSTFWELFHYLIYGTEHVDKTRLLAVWQTLLALGTPSPPLTSAPIVDLGYAQYQGSVDTSANITSFFGIQYAATPVGGSKFCVVVRNPSSRFKHTGELIWAAPQDPPVMSGVQQVTMLPNECYQALGGGGAPTDPFKSTSSCE